MRVSRPLRIRGVAMLGLLARTRIENVNKLGLKLKKDLMHVMVVIHFYYLLHLLVSQ